MSYKVTTVCNTRKPFAVIFVRMCTYRCFHFPYVYMLVTWTAAQHLFSSTRFYNYSIAFVSKLDENVWMSERAHRQAKASASPSPPTASRCALVEADLLYSAVPFTSPRYCYRAFRAVFAPAPWLSLPWREAVCGDWGQAADTSVAEWHQLRSIAPLLFVFIHSTPRLDVLKRK